MIGQLLCFYLQAIPVINTRPVEKQTIMVTNNRFLMKYKVLIWLLTLWTGPMKQTSTNLLKELIYLLNKIIVLAKLRFGIHATTNLTICFVCKAKSRICRITVESGYNWHVLLMRGYMSSYKAIVIYNR